MQVTRWSKLLSVTFLLVMTAVMAACGGGGGTKVDDTAAKATISGAVIFPTIGSLVSKRTAAYVDATDVTIQAYTLDGKAAGSAVKPNYDDTVLDSTKRIYSYSIPGLTTGVDYVIKVTRGIQVLKKLVEKKDVVAGAGVPHNVDAISTAAVLIASNKLSTTVTIVLGEVPPAGVTVDTLSTGIVNSNVGQIENIITSAQAGGHDTLTTESAKYANVLNMVVAAVLDPNVGNIEDVLAGKSTPISVQLFNTATPKAPPVTTSMTAADGASLVQATPVTPAPADPAPADPAPANSVKAAEYVVQAKAYLAKQDIANASNSFELAIAADGNNAEANLGGAITSGLMMLDDTDFKAILARWEVVYPSVTQVVQGTSPIRLGFGNLSSVTLNLAGGGASSSSPAVAKTVAGSPAAPATAGKVLAAFKALQAKMPQQKAGFKSLAKELGMVPATAPSISEMQTLIDNVIMPRIDKILLRLAKIEGKTSNTFTITKAMQGNPVYGQDVVLGDGEYYTLDAALNIFQVLFKISTSYNFDVPSAYTYSTIAQDPLAMINSPTFFTLKTLGGDKMKAALDYAKVAAAKAQLAFDTLKLRASGTGAMDIANWTASEKGSFTKTLADVTNAMNGPTTISVDAKQVNVDFTKFFTSPLDRSDLPTFAYDVKPDAALSAKYGKPVAAERTSTYYYDTAGTQSYTNTWSINCSIEPTSDLPDYSLNGILPGNSIDNNVAGFNGILPMVSGMLLSSDLGGWGNFATDGTSIYATPNFASSSNGGVIPTVTLKKIDLTTGAVSDISGTDYINRLLSYQNRLYAVNTTSQYNPAISNYSYVVTMSPVTISGGTYTVGNPVWTSVSATGWANLSAVTASGTDIYYAVSSWNQLTGTNSTDVRKLSNLALDSSSIFTVSNWIDNLAVSNDYLYSDGDKRSVASPATVVASYANLHSGVLIGGYFYVVEHGKIVKYAGTPSGGTAKTLSSLF